tara:strand:+ start:1197 stop:1346 length:150 start_codon:yes stop_codon:yes gene_type:complete
MKDKKVCFVVMPNTYIGIENAVPFVVSLKNNGWNIYTIFKQLVYLTRIL